MRAALVERPFAFARQEQRLLSSTLPPALLTYQQRKQVGGGLLSTFLLDVPCRRCRVSGGGIRADGSAAGDENTRASLNVRRARSG
jgi:hypothetical protein